MALGTSHAGVFSIQFEGGFIVVESFDRPTVERMAAQTIGLAVLVKLITMHVVVTGGAGRWRTGKLLKTLG